METKVSLKNIYLLFLIAIGLISLGVTSTFAMFTAEANVDNPISFTSNLNSINYLIETQEVTVPAYSDLVVDFIIYNSSDSVYNYSSWYETSSDILEVASSTSNANYNTTGEIDGGDNFTFTTTFRNRSGSSITATVGVSYDSDNVPYVPTGANVIPLGTLPPLINQNSSTYITNLYLDNKDTSTITNNTTRYQRSSAVGLMNDKNGSLTTSDLDSGNIRYYGANPNNYIYFNCDDYLYQNDNNCELWRIIGVFDNKIKIVRNESIGNMSWDTSESSSNSGKGSNDWTSSDIMKLLNPGYDTNSITVSENSILVNNSLYWNRPNGSANYFSGQSNTYTSLTAENSIFKNVGITPATKARNLIVESTWYLGPMDLLGMNMSPATTYKDEREGNTWTGKVGVIYPSDYAYATDISSCTRYIVNFNNSSDDYVCRSNDWLYLGSDEWTFSPVGSSVVYIAADGGASSTDEYIAKAIRPSVYLNSDVYFWIGEGTISNPYKIR